MLLETTYEVLEITTAPSSYYAAPRTTIESTETINCTSGSYIILPFNFDLGLTIFSRFDKIIGMAKVDWNYQLHRIDLIDLHILEASQEAIILNIQQFSYFN